MRYRGFDKDPDHEECRVGEHGGDGDQLAAQNLPSTSRVRDIRMPAVMTLPHVVIVGAGFGGLYAARALRRAPVRVTVIDCHNFHLFQPLLYQVATAALNPSDIAAPIRSILRHNTNTTVLLGDVQSIDTGAKIVRLRDSEIPFDFLVVATGATHSYFGHDEWAQWAPGLKNIDDALDIRRRTLIAYEAAEHEHDPERRRQWLTFVVVGGGPTGVELAGALAEISRHALAHEFRHFNPADARVLLLEGLPRILPTYPDDLSAKAVKQLERLGVEVRTDTKVVRIDGEGVSVADPTIADGGAPNREQRLASRTVLWAAGVQASPLARSLAVELDHAGRVRVRPDLSIPGHSNIYVIGDLAALDEDGRPVPGVAPAAIQMGKHVAANIARSVRGDRSEDFHYVDKGSLATIGRAAGVADFGRLRISGVFAWFAWLTVHIFFLIGFRNRFLVLIQWAWAYVTYRRGARLITGDPEIEIRPRV